MSFDYKQQQNICTPEFLKEFNLPDGKVVKEKSSDWQQSLLSTFYDYEKCFRQNKEPIDLTNGRHTQILDVLARSETDLRNSLRKNLVLGGGNSTANGFDDQL